jgi:hypothetical protein
MEIGVDSSELIDALSTKIAKLVVELETTRLALMKAQKAIVELEGVAVRGGSVDPLPYAPGIQR